MKNKVIFIVMVISLYLTNALANDYCKKQQLGWHFYCDTDKQEKENYKLKQNKISQTQALQQLKQIQQELEGKKALAILYPTTENILQYIKFQREQLDKASYFTDGWQRAIWQNPEYDYTLQRPVANIAKQNWIDQRKLNQKQILANLNQRYGIFFFYRSDCPYCHKYSPILKSFANKYKLIVKAISMDGVFLPQWPDSIIDKGQAQKFGIYNKGVPATILYDNQNKKIIEIGYGILAMSQLEQRIYMLTQVEIGNDY